VLERLGLTFADLRATDGPNNRTTNGRISLGRDPVAPSAGDPLAWWADYCGVPLSFVQTLPLEAELGQLVYTFGATMRKVRKVGTKDIRWEPPGETTPPLWPAPPCGLSATVWLTEGESDATVLRYVGLDAYAVTKGAEKPLNVDQALALRRRGASDAVLCFDADAAGRSGAPKNGTVLRQAGFGTRLLDLGEAGIVDTLAGQKDIRDAWRLCRDRDAFRDRLLTAVAAIPDSRSLNELGIGNGTPSLVKVWERAEPPARQWLVPGLLVEGALNVWYGDAGVFKSWLACALAVQCAAGGIFLGHTLTKAPVVYVDSELDADEFTRRSFQVSRGLGRERPPVGLHYHRLTGSLAAAEEAEKVAELLAGAGAGLVILDSLSLSAFGADLSASDTATEVLHHIKQWGTVLALDHIAKPLPGVNLSGYRPYGSQFKWAEGRCIVQVLKAESGKGLVLRPAKSNFGPLGPPIGVEITFGPDSVKVSGADLDGDAIAGVEEHLPAVERTFRALSARPSTAEILAEATGLTPKTVQNHLTMLRQQERVEPLGGGQWQIAGRKSVVPIPDSLRDRESGPTLSAACLVCSAPAFGLVDRAAYCRAHIPDDRPWEPLP
jgi:hypothetical protein